MKNKRLLNIIGEIDERHIKEAAPQEKRSQRPVCMKWVAIAASFVLVLGIGIPVAFDLTKGPDQDIVDSVILIEYNNAYYEIVEDDNKVLERRGIETNVSENIAGSHVVYLQKDHPEAERSNYVVSETQTNMELLEYTPASEKAVYVFRDEDKYYIALFCNYLITDTESMPFEVLFDVYGIHSSDDIASITPVKNDNSFKQNGDIISDRELISQFYKEALLLEAYSEDAYDKLEFSHIDEENADEYHGKYAEDSKYIVIETVEGLRFQLRYLPTYGWVAGSATQTYYKMSFAMSDWFNDNIK